MARIAKMRIVLIIVKDRIAVKIAKVIIVPLIALEMIVGSIAQGQCAMMGQSVQT